MASIVSASATPGHPQGDSTSVYLYYDEHGVLIYVGITGRGMKRNQEHNKTKEWWQFVASQKVEHYDTRDAAAAREYDLIVTHNPPFNTQHNTRHQDMRGAYILSRRFLDVPVSMTKRMDLDVVDRHEGRATLASRIEDSALAMCVSVPDQMTIKSQTRGLAGRVTSSYMAGPLLIVKVRMSARVTYSGMTITLKWEKKTRSRSAASTAHKAVLSGECWAPKPGATEQDPAFQSQQSKRLWRSHETRMEERAVRAEQIADLVIDAIDFGD